MYTQDHLPAPLFSTNIKRWLTRKGEVKNLTEDELWHLQAYIEWRDHYRYPWEWQLNGDEGRYPEDWTALQMMRNIELTADMERQHKSDLKQAEKDFAAQMRGKY